MALAGVDIVAGHGKVRIDISVYQLGLMLTLVARLAHFLISAAMNFAKSSGELEAAAS
jgi:hypothetical protein